ncbi:lipo-like protein [Vibrio navarrensis]|uniref:YbaY family lipoprotein n=1 Tax=Vibrio navarrensis TaxID=29495 RepID=UPI00186A68BA|nr:YbaY family lipoprotein [Vibrio navarrensis]MBE4592586.1 lipo-like protein [Vibrio navarrensis]
MKKIIRAVMSLLVGVILVGCQSAEPIVQDQGIKTIKGTVSYRERIALPDDTTVIVLLEDVSRADAPSKVIAKYKVITNGAQVPISFDLAYDTKKINFKHTYNVRARIEVNGRLRFTTDTITPVVTDGSRTHQVDLMLVGVR